MIETARARLLLVVVLLTGHAVLFPLYAQQPVNPDAGVFPDSDEFIERPDQYAGERVVTGGSVQQTSPIVIEVETTRGTHNVTVTGTSLSPSIGDRVGVYGTLTAPETVSSTNAFVVPQTGRWYAWGISFLAGIWVLVRLVRHWTIDRARLSFSRRDTPLTARQVWAPTEAQEDEDSA